MDQGLTRLEGYSLIAAHGLCWHSAQTVLQGGFPLIQTELVKKVTCVGVVPAMEKNQRYVVVSSGISYNCNVLQAVYVAPICRFANGLSPASDDATPTCNRLVSYRLPVAIGSVRTNFYFPFSEPVPPC
jgi:hypothetical protein